MVSGIIDHTLPPLLQLLRAIMRIADLISEGRSGQRATRADKSSRFIFGAASASAKYWPNIGLPFCSEAVGELSQTVSISTLTE